MPSRGRPKIVVRLDPAMLAELKAAASDPGRAGDDCAGEAGISGIIREAVAAWLAQHRRPAQPRVPLPLPRQRSRRPTRQPQPPDGRATTVRCVDCGAEIGHSCREKGHERTAHDNRVADAALAAQPPAQVLPILPNCPVCQAQPGTPCIDRDGNTCQIHTARRHQMEQHAAPLRLGARGRRPSRTPNPSVPPPKVMQVKLWLQVERNSKFVRGKKKALEEIEDDVLARYNMKKPHEDRYEYFLTIPYETDEELDKIIHDEILGEAERTADIRNCFIEADVVSLDDPDLRWPR